MASQARTYLKTLRTLLRLMASLKVINLLADHVTKLLRHYIQQRKREAFSLLRNRNHLTSLGI